MEYKLYVFDVDGTLGSPKSGGDFRQTADDWAFYPGRIEACKRLVKGGAMIILASNQGGVCFPWSRFTEGAIRTELDRTAKAVGAMTALVSCSSANAKALPQYFHANDPRRKPNPGMLIEAYGFAGVSPEDTIMIGDRPEDEQAAKAAGVSFMWADEFFR